VLADAWLPGAMPSREDERLVEALRAGLGRLASAAKSRRGGPVNSVASQRRRLDGVEFEIRRKILLGERGRLPQLMPGFVFLVLLPLLGHAEALDVSERASQLLDVA
jgi:hypothetical protein